jgi:hypothetical protein
MEAVGQRVPGDFCQPTFFLTFQFDSVSILAILPMLVGHLEQWAWMHGRWAVAAPDDMSKSSDFLQIMASADELGVRLSKFSDKLLLHQGLSVPLTIQQDVTQLLLRFTTVRTHYVADLVKTGLRMSELRDLHPEFVCCIYAHDLADLPGFLKRVDDQIATQRAVHSDLTWREDYCSRAYLGYVTAFIRCLQGGVAPAGPNLLDSSATASAGAAGPPAVAAQPSVQPPPPPPPPPPPAHSAVQHPAEACTGLVSHRLMSWPARRPLASARPALFSLGSLVAALRASTSPRRQEGSCALNRCYLVCEQPARCSFHPRQANCRQFPRTRRHSWDP